MRLIPALISASALLPVVASAASVQETIGHVLTFSNQTLIPFLLGIAFLFVVINIIRFFVIGGASEDGQKKGKSLALYGVLAFVFIVIFWGAVNFLSNSIGLGGEKAPTPDYMEAYPAK